MHRKTTPIYFSNYKILMRREIGLKPRFGFREDLAKKIYASFDAFESECSMSKYYGDEGGVFNLEFNLDGHTLAAACENKSVVLFDAANHKPYKTIKEAHESCVNCIRYLGDSLFATCSDDSSIKIWDDRRLDSSIRVLIGHTNWVKNIEYLQDEHILISSAFDGSILAWDLNGLTEQNILYNGLYVMNDLMRTRITNDGTKMVLSSTNGYMMIIHDLDLQTLNRDVGFFKPNLYRCLQQNDISYPTAAVFSYLLSQERKRNRIELIDDFPNEPQVISALQLHPMGLYAISRNTNSQEDEEWTAVHDIQSRPLTDYENAYKNFADISTDTHSATDTITGPSWLSLISEISQSLFQIQSSRVDRQPLHRLTIPEVFIPHEIQNEDEQQCVKYKNRVFINIRRLTNYIREKNVGKGFIKEQCFSHDGRIICSPYGRGLRLLAFNEQIQEELAHRFPYNPRELFTMTELINYHSDFVVSCRFNPIHYQLVSGCLNGEIVWYKPVF